MHPLITLGQAALLAGSALAQGEVVMKTWAYSDKSCGRDPNNFDVDSIDITVYKDLGFIRKEADGKTNAACVKSFFSMSDWPRTAQDEYVVYLDAKPIPDDCELIFFKKAPADDDLDQRQCDRFYRRIPGSEYDGCVKMDFAGQFGYAYCCGDDCDVEETDDAFKPSGTVEKRDFDVPEDAFKPIPDAEDDSHSAHGLTARDVTSIKRRAPLDRFGSPKAKRAECKFIPDAEYADGKPIITYGKQLRMTAKRDCTNSEEACPYSVSYTYSKMTSNSWGASASVGGTLFKVIGVEVSFSYEYSESEESSVSTSHEFTVAAGDMGYVTFQPKLECAKGKFEGDCDWDSDAVGDACFPSMIGAEPDGIWTLVST